MIQPQILTSASCQDYELIDSGNGEKLERFGKVILSRPDPQVLWQKNDPSLWKQSQGSFSRTEGKGSWTLDKSLPDRWQISMGQLQFWIKPTPFKHVGIFPEQSSNWQWLRDQISDRVGEGPATSQSAPEILNIFAYTGGATLACAQAGAKVVHVDGSKSAMSWARENAEISGLDKKPIRWILDDARDFIRRELKRGRKYDGIIMDPPAFGHGPNNELWKIEEHLPVLIDECLSLLSATPIFFLMNGYSAGYSAIAYDNNLLPIVKKHKGHIEIGELTLQETVGHKRLLPCGIFARWSAK